MWFKDLIIYTLPVRSYYDSNADGIGDIKGLVQRLDYLEDLGVNALSLLPFYVSPLKDDGYDVADFCAINPDIGTLDDFKLLLEEAHKRQIKIFLELILNHTSKEHAWFKRARKAAPGSPERDFYIWSDTPDKFQETRILFGDYEASNWTWDTEAKAYYFHRFFDNQPDLNYDNRLVQDEMQRVVDFWFGLGVDGMRMTSAAFLYKREGTNCENLPENHEFLRKVRRYVDKHYPGKLLIGEANMWPEDAASYFGNNDEVSINYHFPLMPRLYMALQSENNFPIIDIIEQTPPIPDACTWALFLRNHDDLTLQMVTEEERDYLYKVFAQDYGARLNLGIRRRLAPLLGNDRRKIELMNILLFSLPGVPVLYYGDEIGMGDNIYLGDRKGIRTPMQWNADRNAGFSDANPQRLFLPVIRDPQYRYESVNVETQSSNPNSLLWWMKNILAMRKRLKVFGHGSLKFVEVSNSKIIAFTREHENETVLVVVNLSKYSQACSLHVADFAGIEPVEIISQNKFPSIEAEPYVLTMSPYGYYWFSLEKTETASDSAHYQIPSLEIDEPLEVLMDNFSFRNRLEKRVLPAYMKTCRWFGGKAKSIVNVSINQYPSVRMGTDKAFLGIIQLRYTDGLPEEYQLPMCFISGAELVEYQAKQANAIICKLEDKSGKTYGLIDAIYHEAFRKRLFDAMYHQEQSVEQDTTIDYLRGNMLREWKGDAENVKAEVLKAEQSNTSVIYDGNFFFKIYRKLDDDVNPDLELVRFLSDKSDFKNAPRFGGGISLKDNQERKYKILGLLQNRIPNQGEAWTATLDALTRYYEKVLIKTGKESAPPPLVEKEYMHFSDFPEQMQILIGSVMYERTVLLAKRTAEMHIALASDHEDPDFRPEPFNPHYQRSIYSGQRKLINDKIGALAKRAETLPEHIKHEALAIVALEPRIDQLFAEIFAEPIKAVKTRVHGDYHLGQVLFDGKDFFIIDFEGEPAYSIGERRLKKTPFKDVAGMVRSFHYAAFGQLVLNQNYRKEDIPRLEEWAGQWFYYIRKAFLTTYYEHTKGCSFIPEDTKHRDLLLRNYTLEKAIYEVGYEMNSRPEWLRIPIRGVLDSVNEI